MKRFISRTCVVFFVCLIVAQHGTIAKKRSSLKHISTRDEKRSGIIDSNLQEKRPLTDTNQNTTEPFLQTENSRSRVKRNVFMTDHGYGSRLQASSNVAKGSMLTELYGLHGPGKRGFNMDTDGLRENENMIEDTDNDSVGNQEEGIMVCLPLSKLRETRLDQLQTVPKQLLSKRRTTDFGYGSLVDATGNVARSHADSGIFGITGPGKRSIRVGSFHKRGVEDFPRGDDIDGISSDKRGISDFGYISRIDAAMRLARSRSVKNIFGSGGPGKR